MDLSLLQQPLQDTDDSDDAPASRTTDYRDPTAAIFSMYTTRVQKVEDEKNKENWKGGAEDILVFTGLFSSTVATFIALSYPSLQQDPNVTTQFLLAQISQQLSNTTTGDGGTTTGSSIQSSFDPPTSVVFINSVWFLSLVLSLTCALMATLLQQWARRYLFIVQQKYAPLHRARIHGYFSRGAHRFGISGFVDALPVLLHLSVFLFFAGLVVFAFRSNHIVAYITAAIVGFCAFSYITLTLMPLVSHDCPYRTPLTPILRFLVQIILISFFSVPFYVAKQLQKRWGTVGAVVIELLDQQKNKAKSLSKSIILKLENSAEPLSITIYYNVLVRILHQLNKDHELEEFVSGIPGLYESEDLATHNTRAVLAVLPGLTGSRASLPWDIIQLAQRAFTSRLPKSIQQRRTQACLRALYYIPGAIRDVLAPYAAAEQHCLNILPLLDSTESLEIVDELWNTPNDDVALSVRCVAAVVAAFMINPPSNTLDDETPGVGFIWGDTTGKQFLAKRLHVDDDGVTPQYHPRSDSARLQNIVRFLTDIKDVLPYMNTEWWTFDNASSIRRERLALFNPRHTQRYRIGYGTFDRHGDRASPVFLPAAQQDLITLTLEILVRDPVAGAMPSQHQAFHEARKQLEQGISIQARERAQEQALVQAVAQRQLPTTFVLDNLIKNQALVEDILMMVKYALEPALQTLAPDNDNLVPGGI
ncbi:hypothetical protein BJY52DRAFT_1229238 [Lactarius psammicola]|nr:hypothetical protein BJY52DRAFT_1229238 [Lactarius psammicola]